MGIDKKTSPGTITEILQFCNIWCNSADYTQRASTWEISFDTVLDKYQSLGEKLPLVGTYEENFQRNSDVQSILVHLYKDILDFQKFAMGSMTDNGEISFLPADTYRKVR